jgi:membrane protein YdbS with pleckstrin-like domain
VNQGTDGAAPVYDNRVPAGGPPAITERPSVADGLVRCLDPRSIALERTTGWIVSAVLGAVSFVPIFSAGLAIVLSGNGPWWLAPFFLALWVIANSALAWHLQRWPVIAHRYTSYRVDQQGIEIWRGVVWRKTISVPRSRVQHTDVSQGPLERRYGLGTLVIYTAGTDHARVALSGLEHNTALRIREHLLPREAGDAI